MKKFITLLISGSLTLAAVALAQPPEDQENPHGKKPKKNQAEQTQQPAGTTHEAKPVKQHGHNARTTGQENTGMNASPNVNANMNAGAATTTEKPGKHGRKNHEPKGNAGAAEMNANAKAKTPSTEASASPATATGANANEDVTGKGKHKHGRNARNEGAMPNASAAPSAAAGAATETNANANTRNRTNANAGANVNAGANANVSGGAIKGHGKGGKQLDQQVVQKVKSEHASFKAQARPDRVPAVSFSENHRIEGADRWQGRQYDVFRSYRAERHDRNWYHSRYHRIELIGGGYYYWNNGYWFPAWGYDPGAEYYAYDAPIYVGHSAEPPDKVIADVQAILKEAGYYEGEVDGLLGPLTRQALTDYQNDNGLYATAVIDEPTLESLGLS